MLAELKENMEMLMSQWNVVNAIQDDNKRFKHLIKIEHWINQVQRQIDSIEAKHDDKEKQAI